MSDIYNAPESELIDTPSSTTGGSVESAIAGQFQVNIGELLSFGFAQAKGKKWSINSCVIVMVIVSGLASAASEIPMLIDNSGVGIALYAIAQLVYSGFAAVLGVNLTLIALRAVNGAAISPGQVFANMGHIAGLLLLSVLLWLLVVVGLVLLVIPGIYLMVAYTFALVLRVEKGLGFWESLETSRKAVTTHWFSILGLMIVCGLINLVAAIPLLIGLIWTVPATMIAVAKLYQDMFGVEASTISE